MPFYSYFQLSMPIQTFIAAFISSVLIWYITSSIRAYLKLRHFPGPILATFSYLWLFKAVLSGRAYQVHLATRNRHGGQGALIRIGPDMLITDDAAISVRINSSRAGYGKPAWYSVMRLDPYVHNMISSPDLAFHDDIKARTAAGYTGRDVPAMEADVDCQIEALKALIRRKYLSSERGVRPFDWGLISQYFTLDTVTRAAYGEESGCLAADSDVNDYIKTVEGMGLYFALCSDVPWMGKIFLAPWILNLFGPKTTDKVGLGVTMGFAERIVRERFSSDTESQPDMLNSFIRHGLSPNQCSSEILAQLVAGSDTTANFLRMALVLLATTPNVYVKLQREIDEGIADGRISTPISLAEAKMLPYLQAFLLESLRFRPPVWMLFPRTVPPSGDILGGQFVPGGTQICIDSWSLGRRKDVYGEDVDVFRPERFTEASPPRRLSMERHTELFFGSGRFKCAGQNLAHMEMNKMFVELLREFDFQVMDPEKMYDLSHRAMFVIRNMKFRVSQRNR
ncbi:related to pisatin demethylase [Cephalotrichum gorgonifer]|uniref:Related to pisatin demethylase n=1 Tax=Cephalotrichum gorgonifer TaxID=2041049 RepID=A0AAE8SZT8_9PEZI|nr:related to pisatin demethylase [Cephalotrichum gorgonifer]